MDNIFEGVMGVIAVSGVFGWIPVMVWWKHRIRLEEIRNQQSAGTAEATVSALRELQREMRDLRETTTKFDLSFDAGLDRLEERVGQVERQTATTSVYRNGTSASLDQSQTVQLGQGR